MANSNYQYITSSGVIVPDTADLRTTVENEYKAVLGQNIPVTADTPQGLLISSETTSRVAVVTNNAALANQINPNESGGIFLDAICALLGLERAGESHTRVPSVAMGGQPQTIIQAGVQARSIAGDIFYSAGAIRLDATGNGVVDFIAIESGPVPCPEGALNSVIDMVLGWETVTNPYAGELGEVQQTDVSLHSLRLDTLARQGISTREAQISDIMALPGVRSMTFRENYTDTDAVIDGIFLLKHSVWACVDGGTDLDIATSLLINKTDGANWNGPITVQVKDVWSGQIYNVKLERPTVVPVFVNISVRRNTDVSDPLTDVPQAIEDYANGLIPNDKGLVVGADASPFEYGAAVNYFHPAMTVTKVELYKTGGVPAPLDILIALNQIALTTAAMVTVTIVP